MMMASEEATILKEIVCETEYQGVDDDGYNLQSNTDTDETESFSDRELANENDGAIPFEILLRAVQCGDYEECVQTLECRNLNVNQRDSTKFSLLFHAARTNRQNICQLLIERGADVNLASGPEDLTPLHVACQYGHLLVVMLLLRNQADPMINTKSGMNCLHIAVARGKSLVLTYLLAKNYSSNSTDVEGKSPLIYSTAASVGENSARALLNFNAVTNTQDLIKGDTALHCAIRYRNRPVVKLLLQEKANILEENHNGETPLQLLVQQKMFWFQSDEELLRLTLIRAGDRKGVLVRQVKKFQKLHIHSWPVLLLPMVLFVWTSHILQSEVHYGIKTLLISLGIYTTNKLFNNTIAEDFHRIVPFSFYTSLNIIMYWSWFNWMSPKTVTNSALFLITSLTAWVGLLISAMCDPGYCFVSTTTRNEQILDLGARNILDDRHWCSKCLLQKPLRSRHCGTCKKCVARFDHHCPLMCNCIGWKNHKFYLIFLIGEVVSSYVYVNSVVRYFQTETSEKTDFWWRDKTQRTDFWWIVTQSSHLIFVATWICVKGSIMLALLLLQLYQIIWLGMTTNERLNWRKHLQDLYPRHHSNSNHFPYDTGMFHNLLNFLDINSNRINWMHEYN